MDGMGSYAAAVYPVHNFNAHAGQLQDNNSDPRGVGTFSTVVTQPQSTIITQPLFNSNLGFGQPQSVLHQVQQQTVYR